MCDQEWKPRPSTLPILLYQDTCYLKFEAKLISEGVYHLLPKYHGFFAFYDFLPHF